jgi:four helix bundle protein
MPFVAYDLSLEFVRAVAPAVARVRASDVDLARQAQRALSSVCLNLAEGSGRSGADRRKHFRYARGSFREVRAAFDVALALGLLVEQPAPALADRLGALLWRLTH